MNSLLRTLCALSVFGLTSLSSEANCNVDLKSDPLMWASGVAIVADWGTTLDGARKGRKGYDYYEDGPVARRVIGAHPSDDRVHGYFAGVLASHMLARCLLPEDVSNYVGIYAFLEHGSRAMNNYHIGLRVRF